MKLTEERIPAMSSTNPANVIAQDSDELPKQRHQLAQMLGRLLAKYWLRRQDHETKQQMESSSNSNR